MASIFRCLIAAHSAISAPSYRSSLSLFFGLRCGSQASSSSSPLLKSLRLPSFLNFSSAGGDSAVQAPARVVEPSPPPPPPILPSVSSPPQPRLLPMLLLFSRMEESTDEFGPVVECPFFIPSSRGGGGGGTEMDGEIRYSGGGIMVPDVLRNSRCVGSSHGWLAFISTFDCGLYLSNLPLAVVSHGAWSSSPTPTPSPSSPFVDFPGASLYPPQPFPIPLFTVQLPHISTLPHIYSLDVDEWPYVWPRRFDFLCRKCPRFYDKSVGSIRVPPRQLSLKFVHKIILSSAPPSESSLQSNNPERRRCTVMAILGGGLRDIAFCQLGADSWILLNTLVDYGGYKDIMYSESRQQFIALGFNLELEAWDLRDPSCPKKEPLVLTPPPEYFAQNFLKVRRLNTDHCMLRYYLAESPEGDILVVRRYIGRQVTDDGKIACYHNPALPYRTVSFDVMRFNSTKNNWEMVEDLGDHVLFLGVNHCVSISTAVAAAADDDDDDEFPHPSPNSIYFADDNLELMNETALRKCLFSDYEGIHEDEDSSPPPAPPPAPAPAWERERGGHDHGVFNLKDGRIAWNIDKGEKAYYPAAGYAPPPVWAFSPTPSPAGRLF